MTQTLLDFYCKHKDEMDLILDERAMFVLSFIDNLGKITYVGLYDELPWPVDVMDPVLAQLTRAGMLTGFIPEKPTSLIRPTPLGKRLLNNVLGEVPVRHQQDLKLAVAIREDSPPYITSTKDKTN